MKKLITIGVLATSICSSAFSIFETPPSGAGAYVASPGLPNAPGTYNQPDMTSKRVGNSLPPTGTGPGECLPNTANICAALYDVNGQFIASVQGIYICE